jgi:putative endonuclease
MSVGLRLHSEQTSNSIHIDLRLDLQSRDDLRNLHHVYILRCSNGSLYTGYTTDVQRRLQQHAQGVASKFTRSRLPVELAYFERLASKSLALKREIEIKRMSRAEKLQLVRSWVN